MKTPEWKEQTDKVKASKGLIKITYNRFKINGTRSWSDRIVLEHFDLLKIIYGGGGEGGGGGSSSSENPILCG